MYIMQPTTILDTIVIKIFMQCIKWIWIKKIPAKNFKLLNIMGQIFYMKRRTTENLNAHIVGTALTVWQFRCSPMKIRTCLISLLQISEWTLYWSIFMTTKHKNKKIYWGWWGRVFSALNGYLQESLFLEFVIILIAFFCNLKIFILYGELPQKMMS